MTAINDQGLFNNLYFLWASLELSVNHASEQRSDKDRTVKFNI